MAHQAPPVKVRIAVLLVVTLGITAYFMVKNHGPKDRIEASGTIEAIEVDVSSMLNARVAEIRAEKGKAVKEGEILALLDDSIVAPAYEAARTAYNNAYKNYERSKSLYKSGSISLQQFEAAESLWKSAGAEYGRAKTMKNEAEIRSPWDGIVLQRHVEKGELVSPNTPAFTVGDLRTVKVRIYVAMPDLGKIKLNGPAQIMTDSFKGRAYAGKITHIADEAEFTPKNVQTKDERVKQVFAVEITADNPSTELKPGMQCDVVIKAAEQDE